MLETTVDQQKLPLFQFRREENGALKMRCEFVPADLGPDGLLQFHLALGAFLPEGWGTFIRYGRITRIDLAVDYPNKEMSDFLFLPTQGATVTTWKSDGALETFQSGKPKGNVTQIYNRKAKRIAKGKSWKGKEGIRVERRLLNPTNSALPDLYKLPNPFKSFNLVRALEAPPAGEKVWVWRLFLSAVDRLSLPVALSVLPEDKRTKYRGHYSSAQASWWSPEAVWENWPLTLGILGIGDWNKYNSG